MLHRRDPVQFFIVRNDRDFVKGLVADGFTMVKYCRRSSKENDYEGKNK